MPFSITPLTDMPAPDASDFPNFMQLQSEGVDLGLPDADTLDFVGSGVTTTRGVGENSNKVTVSIAGGAGGGLQVQEDGVNLGAADVDTLNFSTGILATRGSDQTVTITVAPTPAAVSAGVMTLESNPDPSGPISFFDGVEFTHLDWSAAFATVPSDDWDTFENLLHFINAGVYRIVMTAFIQAENEWPNGNTTYGSYFDDYVSRHARTHTTGDSSDGEVRMIWTDQIVVNATADTNYFVGVYARAANAGAGILFAGMTLVIEKLADA